MSKKDSVTKDYIRDTQVFADAFNYFIYNGKQIIDPKNLHEMDTTALAVPYGIKGQSTPVQKHRDELRYLSAMADEKAAYLILGIELQSHIHYAMPVRNALYDALEYTRQVEIIAGMHREEMKTQRNTNTNNTTENKVHSPTSAEYLSGFWKGDTLVPVITLVILLSPEDWDGPFSLHEMFSIQDENILSLVPDYRINFLSPASMSDEEINKFHSSLWEVMLYIKYSKDKKKLISILRNNEHYKNLDRKAAEVISVITNTRFTNLQNIKEDEYNMCQAIDDLCADIRTDNIRSIMKKLNISAEQAMSILDIPEDEYNKYRALLAEPEEPLPVRTLF